MALFKKKDDVDIDKVESVAEETEVIAVEPADTEVGETSLEAEEKVVERVSGGKQTLGFLAFIVLIAGAITFVVNFGLGFAEGSSNPENWVDMIPIILSAVISIFTYIVMCVVAMQFVRGKAKGVKITYWVSTVIAYAFIIIPLVIDIVNVVKETKGN